MGRKAARNMQSSNANKIGIRCVCWSYSQGICYDARSYDRKICRIYISAHTVSFPGNRTAACKHKCAKQNCNLQIRTINITENNHHNTLQQIHIILFTFHPIFFLPLIPLNSKDKPHSCVKFEVPRTVNINLTFVTFYKLPTRHILHNVIQVLFPSSFPICIYNILCLFTTLDAVYFSISYSKSTNKNFHPTLRFHGTLSDGL